MADFLPSRSVLKVCLPVCLLNSGEVEQIRKSKEIDRCLSREKTYVKRLVKILLLGAGESGKSTFLKQMRIIHGQDFDQTAREEFRGTIYSNVIKANLSLIVFFCLSQEFGSGGRPEKLHIEWGDSSNHKHGELLMSFDTRSAKVASGQLEARCSCGTFPPSEPCGPTRGSSRPTTAAGSSSWNPRVRLRDQERAFQMVDVGGQRSERRRWFECFDSVTSILFLVSSSEYDQVLMEDRQTNRLRESLNIFETIVNNRVFVNVSIILFLNKTDLLEEKVKAVPIKNYFPEYTGPEHSLPDVQTFMVDCFRAKRRDATQKPLYHHFTTAVNTENIRLVFRDVKDTILHDNLKQLMLQ
ncbi:hypothetical protein WMY93_013967 [Mugilogobius chulae]|uniref:Guanine nucleotide binding protein (G protein), alpha 13b n=1 Tax=Mugilogobius chulae TaxID=88201 RepID=A0AAW0PDU1_9GOBI